MFWKKTFLDYYCPSWADCQAARRVEPRMVSHDGWRVR